MPKVHGVKMRWTTQEGYCFKCGPKKDPKHFMVEVANTIILCFDCVQVFRKESGKKKV